MTSVKNRLYAPSRSQTVGGHLPRHFTAFYEKPACRTARGDNRKETDPCLIKAGHLDGASGISVMSLIFLDFSAIS